MSIYQRLGVRHVINADARLTRLGGSLMPEPVLRAMAEAAEHYVDMHELQRQVGRRIATLTHNEAAFVCTGAATGVFLTTIACLCGEDHVAGTQLPQQLPAKHEVIIHRAQRIPYDLAIRQTGARLVEIGTENYTSEQDLVAAINERTAAVFYPAGEHLQRGALPLDVVIRIAHAHGIPVIVDAAAQLPPAENLWHFTHDMGADLAIFSGGKDLCGPQASGLIVGKAKLIAACAAHGAPHQRLGRPMKAGKEEMIGLLTAIERYLQLDHPARIAGFEATVAQWIAALSDIPGLQVSRSFPNEAGQPTPRARLAVDPAVCGLSVHDILQHLWDGDPAIAVDDDGEALYITPDMLQPGEAKIIVERLRGILRSPVSRPEAVQSGL